MAKNIHTDLVDGDGIVIGHEYETYYQICTKLFFAKDYLRVVSDGGFTDSETRIPYDLLEKAGFKRVQTIRGEILSGMSDLPEGVASIVVGVELPPLPPDPLTADTIE